MTVAIIGSGFNQLIPCFLVKFRNLAYTLAKLVAISLVMFGGFFGGKKLTFEVF